MYSDRKVIIPEEIAKYYKDYEIIVFDNYGARIEILVAKNNHLRTDIWHYNGTVEEYFMHEVGTDE